MILTSRYNTKASTFWTFSMMITMTLLFKYPSTSTSSTGGILLVEGLEGLGVDEVVELDGLVGAAPTLGGRLFLRLKWSHST